MNTCEEIALETVPVGKENIVHLPLGLLGFETTTRYVLLAEPTEAPFMWLQVLDDPHLAFLVLSPFEVVPDYEMEISPEDTEFLDLLSPADALVYNIVTVHPGGGATMNLKGPIVVNRFTLVGKQVVLANAARYSVRQIIPTAS
jgi:flagellar assembly factor FliW